MNFIQRILATCIAVLFLVCIASLVYVHQTRKRVAESNAKFDSAIRAINAINGAVTVGVSYDQYGKLLQSLSAELFQLRDQRLTEPEKVVLNSYESVLEAFHDAATVWQENFNQVSMKYRDDWGLDTDEILVFLNPRDDDHVFEILEKYKIASRALGDAKLNRIIRNDDIRKVNAPSAIRQIWLGAAVMVEVTKSVRSDLLAPKWLHWLDTHHLEWL